MKKMYTPNPVGGCFLLKNLHILRQEWKMKTIMVGGWKMETELTDGQL